MQDGDGELDYEDLEDEIEDLWDLLEEEKFHRVCEFCQRFLRDIERDVGDDFGRDVSTATLYDDPHKDRRECYIETLRVYQRALRGCVGEILVGTDDIKDIELNTPTYNSIRKTIQTEFYKVAYILGETYKNSIFLTPADLKELHELWREHCQLLLKREFFKTFKIVIRHLGSLDRKTFHKVTEPYKKLRERCHECLEILEVMKSGQFFGEYDTFIEDYERDVNIYLQILWYLSMKTDLNKTDKFLHPNTYNKGLDAQSQIFAAVSLMKESIPHLAQARQVGLSDAAATILLEEYVEYLYLMLCHEEERIEAGDLQPILETRRLLQERDARLDPNAIDLSLPEESTIVIDSAYASLEQLSQHYIEIFQQESARYLRKAGFAEFQEILEIAAQGIGLRAQEDAKGQTPIIQHYRYEFQRRSWEREPMVIVKKDKREDRFVRVEWVENLYQCWKEWKQVIFMKELLDRYTQVQEKTKYRMDFAFKFFRKTWFAFRLSEHKRMEVPNPEGRVLQETTLIDELLNTLQTPLFSQFFEDLGMRYRSRHGLKLQRLRWEWFAERELNPDFFETPKYNYLKYIHTRWKEKAQEHYRALRNLSQREE